ncbi:MAG: hypothetical protein AABY22_24655 [Nanoarchaeota archaeon]
MNQTRKIKVEHIAYSYFGPTLAYHIGCWKKAKKRNSEKNIPFDMNIIYLKGAEKEQLKGQICKWCSKGF